MGTNPSRKERYAGGWPCDRAARSRWGKTAGTHNRQFDWRTWIAPHLRNSLVEAEAVNQFAVDVRDVIAGFDACTPRRSIFGRSDDLDRAISNLPAGKEDDDVIKGFSLIYRKLLTLLDNAGIKVMNPVGEIFNPDLHEP